ncbi:MAG: heavy-metal-associated domain-containing protein [Xenococcaceae cyanobacterium MO_188.B19]|nr:heavy-metal-associated domain-containing protein [Xenococcaceae cyanobacterium MO_188.B19]
MTLQLKVPDMACNACAENITKAILEVDSQAVVKADTETKQVIVETQVSKISIKEAIVAAGYSPE